MSGYTVAIKASAIERNAAVRFLVDRQGDVVSYASRAEAEEVARELSEQGDRPVRVQSAAPQDARPVDGYLVAASRVRTAPPSKPPEEGWTFAIDADQFGELGETVLVPRGRASSALKLYVRQDLGLDDSVSVTVVADRDPEALTAPGVAGEWVPDCELSVALDDRQVGRYLLEVKTGAGSLERNQREIMETVARATPVVLARVNVGGLPYEYEVSFERLGAASGRVDAEQSTLDGSEWR